MIFFNYIFFLFINVLFLWACGQKKIIVPVDACGYNKVVLNGKELFACLLFSTGVIALSSPVGIDLMAIRLLVLESLCILFILNVRVKLSFAIFFYLLFLIWQMVGIVYSDSFMHGSRTVLKYLYFFLIIIFFQHVTSRNELVYTALIWARRLALVSIVVAVVPFLYNILLKGFFWYGTALAINYIFIVSVSIALYYHAGKRKRDMYFSLLFILPCFYWTLRTSIIGTSIAVMTILFFRYRLASLIPISFIFAGLVASALFIPSLREKTFFNQDTANLSGLNYQALENHELNTNGRAVTWDWALEHHFSDSPIVGYGTGHLQNVFYSGNHPFATLKIIHNDYIQILCDNGIIGLLLITLAYVSFIVHCFRIYQSSIYSPAVKVCALASGGAMSGMIMTLYTDNVINYSMCTIAYPAAVYGMMLGLLNVERRNRRALQQS